MKQEKLKLLDLFSGIGGFSLGLESTGFFETIAFVEKDKFCQKILKKNFKNIIIEGDIRNVKGSNYKADVITGGFPCQPFSGAGKRKGTNDDRYLWDETIRIVKECKPVWFIGENVEGIINIQEGVVLKQVCADLENEGFEVQCLIIPASGIGACHQRKRVWILAYSKHNGYRDRNEITSSNGKRKKYRESIGRKTVPPGNLLEQLHMMYPTPAARDHKDSTVSKSHQNRNSDSLPIKMMKMYGTPKAQDCRTALTDRGKGNFGEQVHQENNAKEHGGRLNPEFVEFLMGYPKHWTKVEPQNKIIR
jgi:DNA-cytosine methyltransferase